MIYTDYGEPLNVKTAHFFTIITDTSSIGHISSFLTYSLKLSNFLEKLNFFFTFRQNIKAWEKQIGKGKKDDDNIISKIKTKSSFVIYSFKNKTTLVFRHEILSYKDYME